MSAARSFGRYRVTGTLGAGAMGEVYAAVDEVLGREVAVKTLKGHKNGLAARMLDERFKQEARAIAALAHPGVVQVFDIDLQADPPYLVMERVAGPSLKERFAQGTLPVGEVRALGVQIGRALAAAHAAKIVHRDVKPANILVAGAGTWKLADFGVAHIPDSSLTMTGQFVGSPAYAPPEALVRGQSDAEGDVYGLGATLYQAAAGSWPRLDDTSGALIPPVPPIAQLAPSLPAEIAAVIDRAVAIDPHQRPTASELADALAGAAPAASSPQLPAMPASASLPGAHGLATSTLHGSDASVPGSTPIALPAAPRPSLRWQPWAVGGAVVLMIGVIAATRGSSSDPPGARHGPPLPVPSLPLAAPVDEVPSGQLRVVPPAMTEHEQRREWEKIVDKLYRHKWDDAREELEEWETYYGASPETDALKRQLDALLEREQRDKRDKPKKRKNRGRGR